MTKKWDIASPPELAGEVVEGETLLAARGAARDLVLKKKFKPSKRLEVLRKLGVKERVPKYAAPAPSAPRARARRIAPRTPATTGVPVIDLRKAPPAAPDGSRWGLTDCEPIGEPCVGLGTGPKGSAIVVDHSYKRTPEGLDFRSARISAGISLGAAALKLGLSVSQVSGLENGRQVPKDWAAITKAMLG